MTDTTISDAHVFPQDDGTGVSDGSEDYTSAGYFGLLAQSVGGDYRGAGLQLGGVVNSSNVAFQPGYAFITANDVDVQTGGQSTYDATLKETDDTGAVYVVVLPTVNELTPDSGANDYWLAVDPTANDEVYIRHGNGLSAPSDPNLQIGYMDSNGNLYQRGIANPAGGTHDLGSLTLTSGSDPAYDSTVGFINDVEDLKVESVNVYPETTGQVAADYAYNYDWGRLWDNSNSILKINLTVNWDTDPGTDLNMRAQAVLR